MGKAHEYTMEELLPLATELARKYTSGDSSSVTYESARKIMVSIMFCIDHGMNQDFSVMTGEMPDARLMYEKGYELAYRKVLETMALYRQMVKVFSDYGNWCLRDTIIEGMPQFFLRYDLRFDATNHLLMLDYPLLFPIKGKKGIDLIYSYLSAVYLEQQFLAPFSEERIIKFLSGQFPEAEEMIYNICQPVWRYAMACHMLGRNIFQLSLEIEDEEKLLGISGGFQNVEEDLDLCLQDMIKKYYKGSHNLYRYLKKDLKALAVQWEMGLENNELKQLFPIFHQFLL